MIGRRQFMRAALVCLSGVLGPALASLSGKTYRVQKGDTLYEIANEHGVSVRDLKRANGLSGNLIRVGQWLKLPEKRSDFRAAAIRAIALRGEPLRGWTTIVAHHSAIDRGNAAVYDRAHRRRGMSNGLAYHFVIGNGKDSGDGEIEVGPRWRDQLAGGHVRIAKINDIGIGICLVGNLEEHRPTERQMGALLALVAELRKRAIKGRATLTTHRDVDPGHTVCPGRYFPVDRYLA